MANKFIVFVVFAAVAQAYLASAATGSSNVENARERSRTPWRLVGETVCEAIQNNSWPIVLAKAQFQVHLLDAGAAFLEVAPNADHLDLRTAGVAITNALREGVFKALEEARTCTSYDTTIAEIEKNRKRLPYNLLTEVFHELTNNTDPTDSAEDQITTYYGTLFAEIEKLAKVTCGGEKSLGKCDLEVIHSAIDAVVNTVFGWIEK